MITLHAVGDLVLERADSQPLFELSAAALAPADLVVGQLEIPHLDAGVVQTTDVPAVPGPPAALDGVAEAGFDVLTLAGNHVYDYGPEGIRETIAHCAARGLRTVGTGDTIDEALRPLVTEVAGRRVGIMSVNCVGPRESWATTLKPGCAYIEIISHYDQPHANPGGVPRVFTFAEPRSLDRFTAAVRVAAEQTDVLVVALHKGLVHTPADLADYERAVAHAAIDAGADAVIAHHAHILRGVELYRERPVFHGLGNFATVTSALSGRKGDAPERADWARRRRRLFGFEPDPSMPEYPFHPESRSTMIGVLEFADDGTVAASVIPCWIDQSCRPVPVGPGDRGAHVADYIRTITDDAGLGTSYVWAGDRLEVHEKGSRRP
ncbi:MAG TPA: CapA family protein [Microbacterium sp.]|nr:CapA family protein [Microbacterium sp.]